MRKEAAEPKGRFYLSQIFGIRKVYVGLLVAALFAAEALLSMWTGMGYDMNVWFQTGKWMSAGTNIYLPNDHLGYPPLWAFWCLAAYHIYGFLGNNMEAWRLAVKLPLILAQFGLAFAIGKFAQQRFNPKTAQKIFLLALTWSFFIYIAAFWGQLNMLSALLTFLAFYAVTSKRALLGGVLLGLAVTLKIFPLITLPAFLIYLWKNNGGKDTGKFLAVTCALPVIFTVGVFAAYQWDLLYFLKTIFYWSPVFDSTPTLMLGGCMNAWSFTGLLGVDITQVSILRFLWIPILGAAAVLWLRKRSFSEMDLNLALISLYGLFMLTYAWVTEQMFLDLLPFVFLQVLAYRPRKPYLWGLVGVQMLVFAFSLFNWGPFVFEPFLTRFSPAALSALQLFDPSKSVAVWATRGMLGLAVSLGLAAFLLVLLKPDWFDLYRKRGKQA